MSEGPFPLKQPASRFCYVCGKENPLGLQLDFFNDEKSVWTEFTPDTFHQSWPGIAHGGILSAVLDETIGRAAFLHDKWVQTGKLEIRFRKPAPLGQTLLATAEILKDSGRAMEMAGTIRLKSSGDVIAEGSGLFIRLPDAEREKLIESLGGDFADWEAWFNRMRQGKAAVLTERML
jgi:acyl-coenzyme A thioesterase PaaI-like protein